MDKGVAANTLVILFCLLGCSYSAPIDFPSGGRDLEIVDFYPTDKLIPYAKGGYLRCIASSTETVYWEWLKDNATIRSRYKIDEDGLPIDEQYTSQIWLEPTDDLENRYTCLAKAKNRLGEVRHTLHTFTVIKSDDRQGLGRRVVIASLSGVAVLVVIILLGIIFFKWHLRRIFDPKEIKKFFNGGAKWPEGLQLNELDDYADLKYDSSKEIEEGRLILGRLVGSGQFGEAHAAIYLRNHLKKPPLQVVVKRPIRDPNMTFEDYDSAFRNFIHKELKLTQYAGSHPFIVGYVGAVTDNLANYSVFLVIEYCSGGDLKNYLKNYEEFFHDDLRNRGHNGLQNVLKTSHLLKWAEQIAAGLEYLHSKLIPHMDIAARNILLAHYDPEMNSEHHLNPEPGSLIAKISDLGMARRLKDKSGYYPIFHKDSERNKSKNLPIQWMSLQALRSFKPTLRDDIWSLGVLYWEMFQLGDTPHSDLWEEPQELRNQLIAFFAAGHTLPEPYYAPPKIWNIMKQTWDLNPEGRPSPRTIKEELHEFNEQLNTTLSQHVIEDEHVLEDDYVLEDEQGITEEHDEMEDERTPSSITTPVQLKNYSSFRILEGPM